MRLDQFGHLPYLGDKEEDPTLKWVADEVEKEGVCDCGNKQFVIGIGSYYTGAICTSCKQEFVVHTG